MEVLTNYRGARENWNHLSRKKQKLLVKSRHDVLEDLLDGLFYASSHTTGREQADITGLIGQYAHGNEPSHHIAYLYNATNNPRRTSYWVHRILGSQYQNAPDGLSGNEDCGQMSAWYVMASMGMYPLVPGKPEYQISTPWWDAIHLDLPSGKELDITVEDVGTYIMDYDRGDSVQGSLSEALFHPRGTPRRRPLAGEARRRAFGLGQGVPLQNGDQKPHTTGTYCPSTAHLHRHRES